jgi:hypothetical protein
VLTAAAELVFQVGKRRFKRVILKPAAPQK